MAKINWDKGMEYVVVNQKGTIPLLGYSITACQQRVGMILRMFIGDYKLTNGTLSSKTEGNKLFITVNYEMTKLK